MKAIPLVPFDDNAGEWTRAIYAFLTEKERRSGSSRTVEGYSRMLYYFFVRLGKTPDQVTGPGLLHLRPWHRPIGPRAVGHHGRCPYRLPQFILSVSHSHGLGDGNPVRSAGETQNFAKPTAMAVGRPGP